MVALDPAVVVEHRLPTPGVVAGGLPGVEIFAGAALGDGTVDGAGPTGEAAPRVGERRPRAGRLDRLAEEAPVMPEEKRVEGVGVAQQRRHRGPVVGPGLDQDHPLGRIGGEATGEDRPARPGADDDRRRHPSSCPDVLIPLPLIAPAPPGDRSEARSHPFGWPF